MIQRFSTNFGIISFFVDFLLCGGSLIFSRIVRPLLDNIGLFRPMNVKYDIPLGLYVLFPFIWVSTLFFLSVYDGKKNLRVTDEFTNVSIGSFVAMVSIAGFLYLSYRDIPRGIFIFFVFLTYILMLSWRLLARSLYKRRLVEKDSKTRVLIIGAGPVGLNLRQQLLTLDPGTYQFIGFLDDSAQKQQENKEVIGTIDVLQEITKKKNVQHVFIALPTYANKRLAFVINQLETLPVRVSLVPDYFHLTVHQTTVSQFAGLPILDLRAPALTESQRLAKRIFDIFFTTLFMIPALPLMGVVALLILIFDGKPVLLHANRIGENGQMIKILKFRTMIVGAEKLNNQVAQVNENGEVIHKIKDDPRVTSLGKWLRKLSLDELPQLLNVLRGTISLVGPRPEQPHIVAQYQPWQRVRLSIPQGLTGWWQVQGRSDKPMHLNTEYDLYYIEHYSIMLDFSILLRTLWAVLRGKGAY